MELKVVDLEHAAGKRLAHNMVDDTGRKVLPKGTPIGTGELARLRELGHAQVWVAELAPDDVPEDEAACRLSHPMSGPGIEISTLSTGRANLRATTSGILKVNTEMLRRINGIPGLAIATLSDHTVVAKGQVVATIKVVPYALPRADVEMAELVARQADGTLWVRPFQVMEVGIVLSGAQASEDRLRRVFGEAVRDRVEEVGSQIVAELFVPEYTEAIADAIRRLIEGGAHMIVIAGETSIVDVDDITPRAVKAAGGEIEIYGAPVDPGNLLMLAYVNDVPVVGAPGCVRSRATNVVDLVLPRLLAGEHLTRDDIVELGHGGLLG
ncbi:MAG: molybdopterin-binding protein [Anaerolineae bacterium]